MPSSNNGRWVVGSLKAVAEFFGVSPDTVRGDWKRQGMPGDPRRYPLDKIAHWRHLHDIQGRAVGGDALEQYRHERAKLARLERLERESELVRKDALIQRLRQFANLLRNGGEQLGRMFGQEAIEAYNEAVDDALTELERIEREDGG